MESDRDIIPERYRKAYAHLMEMLNYSNIIDLMASASWESISLDVPAIRNMARQCMERKELSERQLKFIAVNYANFSVIKKRHQAFQEQGHLEKLASLCDEMNGQMPEDKYLSDLAVGWKDEDLRKHRMITKVLFENLEGAFSKTPNIDEGKLADLSGLRSCYERLTQEIRREFIQY